MEGGDVPLPIPITSITDLCNIEFSRQLRLRRCQIALEYIEEDEEEIIPDRSTGIITTSLPERTPMAVDQNTQPGGSLPASSNDDQREGFVGEEECTTNLAQTVDLAAETEELGFTEVGMMETFNKVSHCEKIEGSSSFSKRKLSDLGFVVDNHECTSSKQKKLNLNGVSDSKSPQNCNINEDFRKSKVDDVAIEGLGLGIQANDDDDVIRNQIMNCDDDDILLYNNGGDGIVYSNLGIKSTGTEKIEMEIERRLQGEEEVLPASLVSGQIVKNVSKQSDLGTNNTINTLEKIADKQSDSEDESSSGKKRQMFLRVLEMQSKKSEKESSSEMKNAGKQPDSGTNDDDAINRKSEKGVSSRKKNESKREMFLRVMKMLSKKHEDEYRGLEGKSILDVLKSRGITFP